MAIAREFDTPAFESAQVKEVAAERPRAAHARLTRIGPSSVFRVWVIFSTIALAAFLVAVAFVFVILRATGALGSVEHLVNSAGIGHHFRFSLSWILFRAALVGCVIVVLGSALAACAALIYNSVADAMGGIEIDMAEASREAPGGSAEANGRVGLASKLTRPGRRTAA